MLFLRLLCFEAHGLTAVQAPTNAMDCIFVLEVIYLRNGPSSVLMHRMTNKPCGHFRNTDDKVKLLVHLFAPFKSQKNKSACIATGSSAVLTAYSLIIGHVIPAR
jgi:hypothetical protein